jgi:hypothetical protein
MRILLLGYNAASQDKRIATFRYDVANLLSVLQRRMSRERHPTLRKPLNLRQNYLHCFATYRLFDSTRHFSCPRDISEVKVRLAEYMHEIFPT